MSSKAKPQGLKFGLLDRLKTADRPNSAANVQPAEPPAEPTEAQEVKFTSYLDADLNRRLQIHVANKKSQKKPGQERVSIKSVLDQALREYLERHNT